MTLLSRLQYLGIAKESTPGTYLAATRFIPVDSPKPEDVIASLRDESIRGNDAVLQGLYGGASYSTFDYTIPHLYTDAIGDHLRAILGPDTITAGVSTTLSAATSIGATQITTAVTIPVGSTIQIDTGVNAEYAVTGTPSGAGPFTIPLTSTGTGTTLAKAHLISVAVVSQTSHSFAQDQRANPIPTYSLTQFNKIETRGYPGSVLSDLALKVDPKGAVSGDVKWTGFPSATQTTVAPTWVTQQPFLGWGWTLTLGGVASTRGLSGEFDFKRAVEPINSSDGTQGPREVWAGGLELDFKMKAIFENNTDFLQFLGYTAVPLVSTHTVPLAFGGQSLALTSTGQKFVKFASDFSGPYLAADIEASGAFNATDNGVSTVVLKNFFTTAY